MGTDPELFRLRAELLAIEGLISDLLDQQAKLHSRLFGLEPASLDNDLPVALGVEKFGPLAGPSWASVVKGKRTVAPSF